MKDDKKKSSMSKEDIQAKIDVLQELLDMAEEAKMEDVGSRMQKVSVAAPDKESLEEGLDKAKELVESSDEESMMSEMESEDKEEEEDEEESY